MLTYADVCCPLLPCADVYWYNRDVADADVNEIGTGQPLCVIPGTQFTCFNGTNVQILTQKALLVTAHRSDEVHVWHVRTQLLLLSLLALIVPKYKY